MLPWYPTAVAFCLAQLVSFRSSDNYKMPSHLLVYKNVIVLFSIPKATASFSQHFLGQRYVVVVFLPL